MAKIIIGIAVAAVIIVGFLAIFSGSNNVGRTIKLGVIEPLTGEASLDGEMEARAIQIAVDEINASGGINGKLIEIFDEDSKCNPEAASAAAQKLINGNKVKIIIGGACSGETLAAAKITEATNVVLMSPSVASLGITDAGDFVFRTYPSDALAGEIAAVYAYREVKAKRAALISEVTDYGENLREAFGAAFADLGGQITVDDTYKAGDVDFKTQISKIKNNKPDLIYLVPENFDVGLAVLKKIKESKTKATIIVPGALLGRQAVRDNAEILEGVFGIGPDIDWDNNAKARTLFETYRAKFGGDPGAFAAYAYDAVYLIRDAIQASLVDGDFDTLKIRDWLYSVKDWIGASGKISFDAKGDLITGESVKKILKGEVANLGLYVP